MLAESVRNVDIELFLVRFVFCIVYGGDGNGLAGLTAVKSQACGEVAIIILTVAPSGILVCGVVIGHAPGRGRAEGHGKGERVAFGGARIRDAECRGGTVVLYRHPYSTGAVVAGIILTADTVHAGPVIIGARTCRSR